MGTKRQTGYGTINLSKNIYYDIIREAVGAAEGRCRLGKMNLFLPFLVNDESTCMDLRYEGENLELDVYIIVRFGTSLSGVTDEIIKHIREKCVECSGVEPRSIKVVVTGTESAHGKIRRHIEYIRER